MGKRFEQSNRVALVTPASRKRAAFTLVELLVVIGIIALLISILLPSILAARRQAYLVRCSVNLHLLAHGCLLHAHDHRGYMPLAGMLQIDGLTGDPLAFAKAVNDTDRRRYTYASAPGTSITHVIVPLPAAVAPYLSMQRLSYDNWNTLDQQLNNNRGVWQTFMCPMTDAFDKPRVGTNPQGQGTMMVVSLGGSITHLWSTNADFGINEGVFGFDYRAQYASRRMAGNMSRMRRPSELMLFCDANPGALADPAFRGMFRDPWIMFTPALSSTDTVTLADVLAENNNVMPYRGQLDKLRHRGRTNVVFADGHVETVHITPADLQRVCLTAR